MPGKRTHIEAMSPLWGGQKLECRLMAVRLNSVCLGMLFRVASECDVQSLTSPPSVRRMRHG